MEAYHDHEWGVPIHDDQKLFEYIILDTFQAGLSWKTVLHKRENFRAAFAQFDPVAVAQFTEQETDALMQNAGIVRNRLKIKGAVKNAQAFLKIQAEFGTFNQYIWSFVGHKPVQNNWQNMKQVPASTPASDAMSKDLKKRGFTFVGTTICYAFMQAAGLINDHLTSCPCHNKAAQLF